MKFIHNSDHICEVYSLLDLSLNIFTDEVEVHIDRSKLKILINNFSSTDK